MDGWIPFVRGGCDGWMRERGMAGCMEGWREVTVSLLIFEQSSTLWLFI